MNDPTAEGPDPPRSEAERGLDRRGRSALTATVRSLTLRRWLWITALSAAGAAAFEFFVGIVWALVRPIAIPDQVPVWTIWGAVVGITVVLLFHLLHPLRLSHTQFRYLFRYPPLLVSVVLSLFAVAGRRLLDPAPMRAAVPIPIPWWTIAIILVSASVALVLARSLSPDPVTATAPREQDQLGSLNWLAIDKWVREEQPSQIDLLGHLSIAHRIARVLALPLSTSEESVALVGEFGSGKTTILQWVQAELRKSSNPQVIVSWVSCWGLSDSISAAVLIIERMLDTLQGVVDVTPVRGLPQAYRRVLEHERLGVIQRLVGSDTEEDLLKRLNTLTGVLRQLNLRVVIFVEDVDRTPGAGFEPTQLERLLWILKGLPCITFVVALSGGSRRTQVLDVSRLCEHIATISALSVERVRAALQRLRDHCERDFKYLQPKTEARVSDSLELTSDNAMLAYIRAGTGERGPVEAIAALLPTPRRLKHLIRRVERAWQNLHGEVNLNDLLVMTSLREGAPDVFDFVRQNIDTARREGDTGLDKAPKALNELWKKKVAEDEQFALAAPLVNRLEIRQLSESASSAVQRVQSSEPNDYFLRIVNEEIPVRELRDQEMLRDIANWTEGLSTTMLDKLSAATDHDERYVSLWEYFSADVSSDRFNGLVWELFRRYRQLRPPDAQMPALMSCWRQRHLRQDRSIVPAEQLISMIADAIPVSLPLANELYYFWASTRYGPFTAEDRNAVRREMVAAARKAFSTAEALIASVDLAVDPKGRVQWSIRHLMEPADQEEPPSELRALEDWTWLIPELLTAIRLAPTLILGLTARIVGDVESGFRRVLFSERFRLNSDRIERLFGDRQNDILHAFSDAPPTDDWILKAAQTQSAKLLAGESIEVSEDDDEKSRS
jgi:KAP family P-loop domain